MSEKLIEEITAILQREGFVSITKTCSSVSTTLYSERNAARVLFHLSSSLDLPAAHSGPVPNATRGRDVKAGLRVRAGTVPAAPAAANAPGIKLGAGGGSPRSA
jgi:hypothetical protein